jgi:hypothetical protein
MCLSFNKHYETGPVARTALPIVVDLAHGHGTVNARITGAEQIQIRPVQHMNVPLDYVLLLV